MRDLDKALEDLVKDYAEIIQLIKESTEDSKKLAKKQE